MVTTLPLEAGRNSREVNAVRASATALRNPPEKTKISGDQADRKAVFGGLVVLQSMREGQLELARCALEAARDLARQVEIADVVPGDRSPRPTPAAR